MRIASSILFALSIVSNASVSKEALSPHVDFYQQQAELRFYDSNQVIIKGKSCLAIFDASTDFAKAERFAELITQNYSQPVCYLIASHAHDDHLFGMAILQKAFPDAKLIVHNAVAENYAQLQADFLARLDKFKLSILKSEAQLAAQETPNSEFKARIDAAKTKFTRWQSLTLPKPHQVLIAPSELDLGNLTLSLMPTKAHSEGDIMLWLASDKLLFGADVVDLLPYLGEADKQGLYEVFTVINALQPKLIIPGHGAPYKLSELANAQRFVTLIWHYAEQAKLSGLTYQQATERFDYGQFKISQNDELTQRATQHFVAAGIKRAYQESKK